MATLLAGCSKDPETVDHDHDGLDDSTEVYGWNVTAIDGNGTARTYRSTSDATLFDTDGDGLADIYERTLGLDARKTDTDGDGLTDCQEVQDSIRSHCEDQSWHGLTDGGTKTRADHADTDGDGLADGVEILGYDIVVRDQRKHTTSNPLDTDSDHDFLGDALEMRRFHTDPSDPDTDSDGCKDGLDPLPVVRETFAPGLRTLHFNGSQAQLVRITIRIADTATWPAGERDQTLAPGDNDYTMRPAAAVRAAQCSFPPTAPRVPVELTVERVEGDAGAGTLAGTLDLSSGTNPGSALRVWWDVAAGTMSWDQDGHQAVAQPLSWAGKDGSVTFQPVVVAL